MASVVVIDDNTLNEMFENDPNPLGKVIIFNKKPLTVIGVTEKDSSPGPSSETMNIWVPIPPPCTGSTAAATSIRLR